MSAFRSIGCILNGIHKKAVSKLAGFCFVLTIIFLPSQLLADILSPEEKLLAIKLSLIHI